MGGNVRYLRMTDRVWRAPLLSHPARALARQTPASEVDGLQHAAGILQQKRMERIAPGS